MMASVGGQQGLPSGGRQRLLTKRPLRHTACWLPATTR
jgi:hypothetical protein